MVGSGDAVFGVVILLFLILGFRRGVSLGLFAAAGVVAVVIIATSVAGPLGRAAGNHLGWQKPTASAVGFAILFMVGLVVLWRLRAMVKRWLLRRQGGFVDSIVGALLWGALGFVFIVLCLSVLLVSHREIFGDVPYRRSAACRFIFDRAPLVRDLKTWVERPREPKPTTPTDLELLERGFRRETEDDGRSETDR